MEAGLTAAVANRGTLGHIPSVISIEAHPIVRWGVKRLIEEIKELRFVGEANNPTDGLALVRDRQATMAVIGLDFPDGSGFALLRELMEFFPGMRVLVLSGIESLPYTEHCLQLGAKGYVCKNEPIESLQAAIEAVAAGKLYMSQERYARLLSRVGDPQSAEGLAVSRLSGCELDVFHQIGQGKTNQQIAVTLHRSIKTIETYRTRIRGKLGFQKGEELSRFAFESRAKY